ncbi:uncharacterized protein HD556DRAFT_1451496 [Suillus plorans]|uniref:Uncharacterized protein n=1 Tax=Suillus plorans TaxID=116603 RepID=A0A9P7A9P8_9AGAM|nr:uncharacterized protein HD556DRAFT_1451496 [Suillus plorans]KAG1784693.1 hypothetical protein HD556DRAFT_1451496 [Suillus plorans]
MPNTSTALSFGPVDCSDKVDVTGKVGVAGNHIFMDVENLLVDWPTYTIKFTPTHPGPVTLILRLKDVSRFKYVEDEDSDMETSESKACKISSSSTKDDLDATFVFEETTSKTDDNPNLFIATPVRLDAIRKDFSSKKCKLGHGHFFGDADSAWPPRWPLVFLVHPRVRYVSKASKICLSTNLIHQRAVECEHSQEASQNAQPGTIKRMQFTFSIDAPPAHSLQLHLHPTPSLAKAPPPPSQTSSLALSSEKVAGTGEVTDPLSLTMLLPTPHPTRTVFLLQLTTHLAKNSPPHMKNFTSLPSLVLRSVQLLSSTPPPPYLTP